MKNYSFGILALAALTLFGCDRTTDKPNDPNRPKTDNYTTDTFPSNYHQSGSDPTDYRSGVNASDRRSDKVILPDNTGLNVRDRSPSAILPENQLETPADREITKLIRQAIVADDTLSFYGKNVKIITRNGEVTLRGVVEIQGERDSIGHKASGVKGVTKVNNLIEAKRS